MNLPNESIVFFFIAFGIIGAYYGLFVEGRNLTKALRKAREQGEQIGPRKIEK